MRSFVQPRFMVQGFHIFLFFGETFSFVFFFAEIVTGGHMRCLAVEFQRGMRHFHLSLCSFVDTLRT